ncbi:hypothetical protein VA596_31890 [Amycolatopsis sp., V23-08]|uniref:DUF222 domain-containing protein n=1 Tax=Amycolatopsis heterodermiae TaxID=3110235 RepID=A0ABU5RDF6_9PSEU|nr:hypothetical protein [Amycolatopsis sp., V23-08]MEA5364173.1 hypothetical protein [Amycolatopsis sp., V23-08]
MTDEIGVRSATGEPSFACRGEDLTRLLEFLAPDAATVAAASGMAGIGKTERSGAQPSRSVLPGRQCEALVRKIPDAAAAEVAAAMPATRAHAEE